MGKSCFIITCNITVPSYDFKLQLIDIKKNSQEKKTLLSFLVHIIYMVTECQVLIVIFRVIVISDNNGQLHYKLITYDHQG